MSYSRPQWQTAKTFLKIGNLGLFLFTCPLLLEWTSLSHRSLISTRANKILFLGNQIFSFLCTLFLFTCALFQEWTSLSHRSLISTRAHKVLIFGQNSVPSLLTYDPSSHTGAHRKTFLLLFFCIKFVQPDQG